jgi:hypothetical protein
VKAILQFFAGALLLLVGLNVLSQWPAESHAEIDAMTETIGRMQGHRAVSLGGSSAVAIDFRALCIEGVPFYHNAQDLFEIATLGNLILDRPRPPKYWFVETLPTAQLVDNGSQGAEYFQVRRDVYRAAFALGDHRLIAGDWRQAFVAAAAPSLGSTAWHAQFQRLWRWLGVASAAQPTETEYARLKMTADQENRRAPGDANDRRSALYRMRYYDPDIGTRAEATLQQLNARIRASGGVMIVVVPPSPDATRAATIARMPNEVAQFDHMLRRLQRQGAVVADHWADPLARQIGLFRDPTHLNGWGVSRFSRQLGTELRKKGILPATANCDAKATPPQELP